MVPVEDSSAETVESAAIQAQPQVSTRIHGNIKIFSLLPIVVLSLADNSSLICPGF